MKGKNKWSGFTLIESIVGLAVVSLMVILLNMLIKVETKTIESIQQKSEMNWHVFLSQLEYNSNDWKFKEVKQNRLYFVEKSDKGNEVVIVIEKYANQLKERKNGGYNPLLMGVEACNFSKADYGVIIDVTMEDGKKFKSVFPQWK